MLIEIFNCVVGLISTIILIYLFHHSSKNKLAEYEEKIPCPVREKTADGNSVGRCWLSVGRDNLCIRHGDVTDAVQVYKELGQLTDEHNLRKN